MTTQHVLDFEAPPAKTKNPRRKKSGMKCLVASTVTPDDNLPVFNLLSFDGGRCEQCKQRRQEFYLSCYSRSGAHLPNRFVCDACLPVVEAEARKAGRVDRFEVA